MRLIPEFKWHARSAGGLFLGLRIQFPVRIVFCDGAIRDSATVSFGFLLFSVGLIINGKVLAWDPTCIDRSPP